MTKDELVEAVVDEEIARVTQLVIEGAQDDLYNYLYNLLGLEGLTLEELEDQYTEQED